MIEIALANGGTAWIAGVDGEQVILHATVAAPPGSPLSGSSDRGTFQIKVRGCRRIEGEKSEERFRIEGRFINLTRAQRTALAAATEGDADAS